MRAGRALLYTLAREQTMVYMSCVSSKDGQLEACATVCASRGKLQIRIHTGFPFSLSHVCGHTPLVVMSAPALLLSRAFAAVPPAGCACSCGVFLLTAASTCWRNRWRVRRCSLMCPRTSSRRATAGLGYVKEKIAIVRERSELYMTQLDICSVG